MITLSLSPGQPWLPPWVDIESAEEITG